MDKHAPSKTISVTLHPEYTVVYFPPDILNTIAS